MTRIPLEYGRFQLPDERSQIQARQDFDALIAAAYAQWSSVAEPVKPVWQHSSYDYGELDSLYDEAVNILKPHTALLENLDDYPIPPLRVKGIGAYPIPMRGFNADEVKVDLSGIFLTALLNLSKASRLAGVFDNEWLGYRLASGKTLVLKSGSTVGHIGSHIGDKAEGTIVVQASEPVHGDYVIIGADSNGATIVNDRPVQLIGAELPAKKAMVINNNFATGIFVADHSRVINTGTVKPIIVQTLDCMTVNYGRLLLGSLSGNGGTYPLPAGLILNFGHIEGDILRPLPENTVAIINMGSIVGKLTGRNIACINYNAQQPLKDRALYETKTNIFIDAPSLYSKSRLSPRQAELIEPVKAIEQVARNLAGVSGTNESVNIESLIQADWNTADAQIRQSLSRIGRAR